MNSQLHSSAIQPVAPEPPESRPPFNEISVLFPLLSIYTAGYMGLMVADFALKNDLDLSDGIMPVYIALLGAYAADKEIRRWLGTAEPPRKGTLFVYLWMLLFMGCYVIHTFQPAYELPANLLSVCIQVLGIFFGSKASKHVCEKLDSRTGTDSDRKTLILNTIRDNGQVTRQTVIEKLRVSRATAGRLLAELEADGAIRRKGSGKGIYYVLS